MKLANSAADHISYQWDSNLATLLLDEKGVILDCDGDVESMFGYDSGRLVARHISTLLPRFQFEELIEHGRLNPNLHYLCHIGLPFQVRRSDAQQYPCYLSITDRSESGRHRVRMCIRRS